MRDRHQWNEAELMFVWRHKQTPQEIKSDWQEAIDQLAPAEATKSVVVSALLGNCPLMGQQTKKRRKTIVLEALMDAWPACLSATVLLITGVYVHDDSSSCDSDDSSQYYDEIEQPHRTLGLLFFDFIRFIAISANLRCVNTQLMPIFMCYGKCEMDLLSVVLR